MECYTSKSDRVVHLPFGRVIAASGCGAKRMDPKAVADYAVDDNAPPPIACPDLGQTVAHDTHVHGPTRVNNKHPPRARLSKCMQNRAVVFERSDSRAGAEIADRLAELPELQIADVQCLGV